MAEDDIGRYRNMLHDANQDARARRKQLQQAKEEIETLKKQLSERDAQLTEYQAKFDEYETALVELDDYRLELETQAQNIPQELEDYRRQSFLDQHKEAFKQMLGDTGLHPQASLDQLWQMVGYDPFQIEELSPELVNEVLGAAKQQAPFLFMGKDVSQSMPSNQYQTGPQAVGSGVQQGFVQPSGFTGRGGPAMNPAPTPPQGWSQVASRGVPISSPPQAIQGRFQDPKWIAANQKAIAEAVEAGHTFVSSD
jgi:hypothetical protein